MQSIATEVKKIKKKVTIYTLAEELGMTPSMVSRALSPNGRVNEQKRQLVIKTAKKYNFVPNRMASRLSGAVIKIGIILNTSFKAILEDMKKGIEEAYEELKDYKIDYTVKVFEKPCTVEQLKEYLEKFKSYDGVILAGFCADEFNSVLNDTKIKNIVQLQNVNEKINYLFSSVHDIELASTAAAEFLADCLRFKQSKNILLLTGSLRQSLEGNVHWEAKRSFLTAAEVYGLNVVRCAETDDSEEILASILPEIFRENSIDGVYITSGISLSLCEFVKQRGLNIPLVTFDVYKELNEYIKDGTVTATIFQNARKQAKTAFEKLVLYVINNEMPQKKIKTSVHLVMKSNLSLYE